MNNATPTLDKLTKKEFFRRAQTNGLALLAALWRKSMDEILTVLDKSTSYDVAANATRDKVTGNPARIERHTGAGNVSYLYMDKHAKCYAYGPFLLVRAEYEDGQNSTVIYAN